MILTDIHCLVKSFLTVSLIKNFTVMLSNTENSKTNNQFVTNLNIYTDNEKQLSYMALIFF